MNAIALLNKADKISSKWSSGPRLLAGLSLYTILLIASAWLLSSQFYAGYTFYDFDFNTELLLYVILVGVSPAVLMPKYIESPGSVIVWFVYLIGYIPAITLPFFTSPRFIQVNYDLYELILFSVASWIGFIIISLQFWIPRVKVPIKWASTRLAFIGSLLLLGVTWLLLLSKFGIPSNPFPTNISEVRQEWINGLSELPAGVYRIFVYISGGAENTLVPLILSISAYYKKYSWAVVISVFIFYLYSISAFKSSFFALIFTIGLVFILRQKDTLPGYGVLSGILILSVSFLAGLLASVPALLGIIRRFFLTVGVTTGFFIDYFSENPITLLSSRTYIPLNYPYDYSPARIIGLTYFESTDRIANVNFLGEGYAAFGWLGVVLMCILFAFIIWVIDSAASNTNLRISGAATAGHLTGLVYASLLTTLLEGGLWMLIILYMLLYRQSS